MIQVMGAQLKIWGNFGEKLRIEKEISDHIWEVSPKPQNPGAEK